jgi:hypothetical protein
MVRNLGNAGLSVPNLLVPLQEFQPAKPLFTQPENARGENQNRDGHSKIVGIWIVNLVADQQDLAGISCPISA